MNAGVSETGFLCCSCRLSSRTRMHCRCIGKIKAKVESGPMRGLLTKPYARSGLIRALEQLGSVMASVVKLGQPVEHCSLSTSSKTRYVLGTPASWSV